MKKLYKALSIAGMHLICFGAEKNVEIAKVFFHTGILADKIVFYFEGEPICNQLPKRNSNGQKDKSMEQLTLFMPLARMHHEDVRRAIEDLNNLHGKPYKVAIKEVSKPLPGIQILISYDTKKVSIDYKSCEVVSGQKSLILSFHYREVLNQLNQASNQILQYVHAQPSKQKRIVLDCGHGGTDKGTVSAAGIKEKDITLQVGKKIAQQLKQRGYDVSLTRADDSFVPLDKRTLYANQYQGDLLLSIHANHSPRSTVSGVETYWTARSEIHNDAGIINNWYKRFDLVAEYLAESVHASLLKSINQKHQVADRGKRKTVAQVLIGGDMPSTLVEIGFLSNHDEAKKLSSDQYQNLIVSGICDGIDSFYAKFS